MTSNNPTPKKKLGQHWLEDKATLREIVSYADLDPNEDIVLEIGPGLGSLTSELVNSAKSVIAVELDKNLSDKLKKIIKTDNLDVVNGDILTFDLNQLNPDYKIVANIPYYLTSNLIRVISETTNPPELIVLLVQKEVAERLAALPGSLSILGVTTQFYWEVEQKVIVPAEMFTPPPRVDSQVVVLSRRPTALFGDVDTKKFFRLVKIGFSARRKTLENSLSNGFREGKDLVSELLREANLDPSTRPQNLSLEDWHKLYKVCIDRNLI